MTSIFIDKRFRGPPNSGNGGYVCGRLARNIPGAAEITLHAPPPLETRLEVAAIMDNSWELRDGANVIATGRPTSIQTNYLDTASFKEINKTGLLAPLVPHEHEHPMPTCFVCGPKRAHCDGLRIFPQPIAQQSEGLRSTMVAAAWIPDENLSGPDGFIESEFIWSALDCPTGYASCYDPIRGGFDRTPVLLGRMSAQIQRRPHPGECCVITAWSLGHNGRKRFAKAAIYDEDCQLLAAASATWIETTHQRSP